MQIFYLYSLYINNIIIKSPNIYNKFLLTQKTINLINIQNNY